jgi:ATP-dependent helicase/nuclease subunit A
MEGTEAAGPSAPPHSLLLTPNSLLLTPNSLAVWREKPFVLREEDVILSGSIDRLVVLYDGDRAVGADVLDFKTDVLPAGDPAAIAARIEFYRPQLAAYRRAAARLLGLEPDRVSARLVFTELGEVRNV